MFSPLTGGNNEISIRVSIFAYFYILVILPSVGGILNTSIVQQASDTMLTNPENGQVEVILWEDFESYTVGSFPSSGGWELVFDGQGAEYQIVTDMEAYEGSKSLQLWGQAWWSAVAQHPIAVDSSTVLLGCEQAIMISERNPNPSGTPHERACVFWNRDAGTWGKGYSLSLIHI